MKIHVKIEDTTYEVSVGDLSARPVIASVDGQDFEVWPEEMSIPGEAVEATTSKPASIPQAQKPTEVSNGDTKSAKAPLPGVIGAIMALEAVKHLTGAGATLRGALLIHDALWGETRRIAFDLSRADQSLKNVTVKAWNADAQPLE